MTITFTTVSTYGLGLLEDSALEEPCTSSSEFCIGDLRGGATSPLESHLNTRSFPKPVFELSRAGPRRQGLRILKIQGDGRCLFRALAKGLAHNQGAHVSGGEETRAADLLRMAVHDAICRDADRAKQFEEVNYSVEQVEGGKVTYCKRLSAAGFWGGELEILVLSKMLHVPIYVYRTAEEAGVNTYGYVPIVRYGEQWAKQPGASSGRQPVNLLYGQGNHYDLLL